MKLLALTTIATCLFGCTGEASSLEDRAMQQISAHGISIRLDALTPTRYLSFVTDEGRGIAAPSLLGPKNVANLNYENGTAPAAIKVKWYRGVRVMGRGVDPYAEGGAELVRYQKVDIANRIPKEVFSSLQKEGGSLRIKIRLTSDEALLGWDIERQPGYQARKLDDRGNPVYFRPEYFMAGGDFQEATILNGKVARKGWYINKNSGQKIETDF